MLLFSKSVSSTHADKCYLGILVILSKLKTILISVKKLFEVEFAGFVILEFAGFVGVCKGGEGIDVHCM